MDWELRDSMSHTSSFSSPISRDASSSSATSSFGRANSGLAGLQLQRSLSSASSDPGGGGGVQVYADVSSDEFKMFLCKVVMCPNKRPHDW
mgnify:CR=1 FL=1